MTPSPAADFLRRMLRIRIFERKAAELYSAGKIRGFLHLYDGQEAIAVGSFRALRPEDAVVANYREHAHAIERGVAPRRVMAELLGKTSGVSRGRGGSMHLFDAATHFYGGFAIVAEGLPVAAGLALARRMTRQPGLVACYFGDGATDEGEFHETMNLAALWNLPLLFLCENNFYAMGTALSRRQARTDIALKAGAYGMPAEAVDGQDVFAVAEATRRAAEAVRRGEGPRFIEFRTYRFRAHSMYDPELYRSREEVEKARVRDPIALLAGRLRRGGTLDDAAYAAMEREVEAEVDEAANFAAGEPVESVEDLLKDVVGGRPS